MSDVTQWEFDEQRAMEQEIDRLRAELAKCRASLAAIYVMADRVSPGTIRDECIAAVPTILDALEGVK